MRWTVPDLLALSPEYYEVLLELVHEWLKVPPEIEDEF